MICWKIDFTNGKLCLRGEGTDGFRVDLPGVPGGISFRTVSRFWDTFRRWEPTRSPREILLEILPGHKKLVEAVAMYRATKALEALENPR